ncbi:MAG: zinc metalloprotease [Saprospirales bacterium]|nr:zinc metalloprotease [Saprospirales bacterium]
MKAPALFTILLWLFFSTSALVSQRNEPCLASQLRQEWWNRDAENYRQWQQQNRQIREWLQSKPGIIHRGQVITIPVVVHIVWNSPEENLSDAEILSQIDALNRDFRALNDEVADIPFVFKSLVADVELEFCLAGTDPDGQPTNGITRTFTNNDIGIGGTSAIHYSALGGKDAWDPSKYLNIWVAKFAGGVSGTSSFPGQGPPEEDGVEINYRFFGTLAAEPPYNLGRTLTHEVGHYFNLEHPWGPNVTDCCQDDFVADTPEACETYLGQCPVHPVVSCDEPDMFMNYMFYTDDACMAMFTLGQKARMLAALSLFRSGLLNAGSCATATTENIAEGKNVLYPNPASSVLHIQADAKFNGAGEYIIFDVMGREVQAGTLGDGVSSIDVEGLRPGYYTLQLLNDGEVLSAHFLKH